MLAQCDLCGPPLQPIVLEEEDWNNLHEWFSHLWPPASKGNYITITNALNQHTRLFYIPGVAKLLGNSARAAFC